MRNAGRPEFLVGGYLAYDYRTASDSMSQAVSFADRSVETFATKTSQTMLSLLDDTPRREQLGRALAASMPRDAAGRIAHELLSL